MISSAYQYFLSEYAHMETNSRYNAHKESELKSSYNNIMTVNKKTPLFKIDLSENTKYSLIDLKENSRIFRNRLYEIFGSNDSEGDLQRKSPYTSNSDVLDVEYIGNTATDDELTYLIKVKQLAAPQVNIGDFLHSDSIGLPQGTYSFDLNVGNNAYEFQFKVGKDTTNLSLQEKLAKLINRSDIGITASINKDANGSSAIEITSTHTGTNNGEPIFHFSDEDISKQSGSVAYLGLNKISQLSHDAVIEIDGREASSSDNVFTINKTFQIELKSTTQEDEYVEIGFQRLPENISSELHLFADTYNNLYKLADGSSDSSGSSSGSPITQKLSKELSYISGGYSSMLETIGLSKDENGLLKVNDALVLQSAKDGTLDKNYSGLIDFQHQLLRETAQISTNPFEYLTRTVVSYPNPSSPSYAPYQTTLYTGLLFDGTL